MLILRYFSGITVPVITGYHPDVKRRQQSQKFAAGIIRARSKRISQNVTCFGVVCIPEPVLPDKAPLLIEFTDKCYICMSDRKGVGVVIRQLAQRGDMAILLLEQIV